MAQVGKVTLLVGPPGTGKTRTLLGIIRERLEAGMEPESIGFLSFTRAAIREARSRAIDGLALDAKRLIYWGTIHSLCFRHLGLRRERVMVGRRWREFCAAHNLKTAEPKREPSLEELLYEAFEPTSVEEADIYRAWWDWTRARLLTAEAGARQWDPPFGIDWSVERALGFARLYEAYKRDQDLWDFTDMLLEVEREQWCPPVRLLVVDEAQDLTPLQQRLVLRWAYRAEEAWFACDPDQAIYSFAGAEPDWLVHMDAPCRVLEQSYRVPDPIARAAQQLIARNRRRIPVVWKARSSDGVLLRQISLWVLEDGLAAQDRSWYLLARNRMYLDRYTRWLHLVGVPYRNLSGPSPLPASKAVVTALLLAHREAVSVRDLAGLAKEMRGSGLWEHGAKQRLQRVAGQDGTSPVRLEDLAAFGATELGRAVLADPERSLLTLRGMERGRAGYLLQVAKRYGISALVRTPAVTLATEHAVKGGEADCVVITPEITRRTYLAYQQDPEPERRVAYVGMTRARKALYILEPMPKVRGYVFEEL